MGMFNKEGNRINSEIQSYEYHCTLHVRRVEPAFGVASEIPVTRYHTQTGMFLHRLRLTMSFFFLCYKDQTLPLLNLSSDLHRRLPYLQRVSNDKC